MFRRKKLLSAILTAAMALTVIPANVNAAGDYTKSSFQNSTFADYIFDQYTLNKNYQPIDTNRDGRLSADECNNVTKLAVTSLDVTSVQGIEYFPNLEMLECSDNPRLTSLNISQNTKLTNVAVVNTAGLGLTSITIGNNSALTFLVVSNNNLSSINVSGCPNLDTLNVNGNRNLTSIDISNCTKIRTLNINNTGIRTVNISKCTELLFMYNHTYRNTQTLNNGGTHYYYMEKHIYAPAGCSVVTSGNTPTTSPVTTNPTTVPTTRPTQAPTQAPTNRPTTAPTSRPTTAPTQAPTNRPANPTQAPSNPTQAPSSESGVGGFVERLYTIALERNSDPNGKADWVNRVYTSGATGADVAQGFLFSPEFLGKDMTNEAFLDVLYRVFFDRPGDQGGVNYWLGQMAGGMDKQTVIWGFINSTEWANVCLRFGIASGGNGVANITVEPSAEIIEFATRLYTTCLGRNADQNGLMDWARQLANRQISGSQAAAGFFTSGEFVNANYDNAEYINRLYRTFMGREADQGGFDYWMGQFAQGASREDVFNGFAGSAEWAEICSSYGILK